MVGSASSFFTGNKLQHIIHDKPYFMILQMGEHHILLGPVHHTLAGINVYDLCRSRTGTCHGCPAGIGEQIQHTQILTSAALNRIHHPVPVRSLLGEQAGMLESGWRNLKAQIAI